MTETTRTAWDVAAVTGTVAGLGAVAVAHPILDLVARHPEFLVAHHLSRVEIWVLALGLLALVAAAGAVVAGVGRFWPPVGESLLTAAVAALVFVALLPATKRLPLPDWAMVGVAGGGGLSAAVVYRRGRGVRQAARYLGLVPVVVGGWFVLSLPGGLSATAAQAAPATDPGAVSPTPVVVLILDELPLASLIDSGGDLLVDRFPGFGRLAADGTWYRNAITVQTGTTEAIPAILSGRRVERGTLPLAANHPDTLMTVLGDTHHVQVVEAVTDLCPPQTCAPPPVPAGSIRWRRVAEDVAVIFGHAVSPPRIASHLPSLDEGWAGFLRAPVSETADGHKDGTVAPGTDRRVDVGRFLDSLRATEAQSLNVGHLLLPHRPWEFLPDGSAHHHPGVPGYDGRGWGPDPYHTAAGYQLHLLQAQYADSIVAETITALEDAGVYESSLIVVTADHGVVIEPDVENMRRSTPDRVGSLLAIPLFIKFPEATGRFPPPGTVDDVRALTTDIVPTILDVVAETLPSHLDGASLLSDEPASRGPTLVELGTGPTRVPVDGEAKLAVAAAKEAWFPDGDPWTLIPDAGLRPLLGTSPEDLWSRDSNWIAADLEVVSPPLVTGTVHSASGLTGDEAVVVASRDRIVGMTMIHPPRDEREADFTILIQDFDAGSLAARALPLKDLLRAAN